jgi:hypothetical protein
MFGIAMFLMKDWRNTPGTAEVLPYLDKVRQTNLVLFRTPIIAANRQKAKPKLTSFQYFPAYGVVARAHGAAKQSGDIVPGEQQLLG